MRDLEQFRTELTGYSYRMLGSAFEAEDAVQEAMVRAWRNIDTYDEERAPLRAWIYRITTNVCIDMLRSAQRRARAMDLGPATALGAGLGAPLPENRWLRPVPDAMVLPFDGDPADIAAQRETIRLAFVAALQHLPPRQRAALILCDVLCWSAVEAAAMLDTTAAGISSALQRARATLATRDIRAGEPYAPMDGVQQEFLARYVKAFESHDVATLVELLHEDVVTSMPPFRWWLRGRETVRAVLTFGDACKDDRLVPTVANGSPAFGQYRPDEDGRLVPFALLVLEIRDGAIVEEFTDLDGARLFPLFGLPSEIA
ncbi:sigma-70 family RNA polymerase sigma factor [Pseudonocardia sp. TRM90224]|uniref:sigma-70 family RNA polymerase sigma factor n=1 Tax=Pseudonocardia sp. TRM90224 TaxID=2812678 RepID=UPI001E63E532|nr:sigma-70 family RNA polymerase sigma factor [Pseudonocardia sp. TRM90224]